MHTTRNTTKHNIMMAAFFRPSALMIIVLGAAISDAQPANDLCTTATEIFDLPFYTSNGTLANATAETFPGQCYGNDPTEAAGVWYKIQNVIAGTELMVGFQGEYNRDLNAVEGRVLMTNNERGECPDEFLCMEDLLCSSSVSVEDPIPGVSFQWTAAEDEIYYVYLFPSNSSLPGPEYNFNVWNISSNSPTPAFPTQQQAASPTVPTAFPPVTSFTQQPSADSSGASHSSKITLHLGYLFRWVVALLLGV